MNKKQKFLIIRSMTCEQHFLWRISKTKWIWFFFQKLQGIKDFQPQSISDVSVSAESIRVLREALRRVVQNPRGTGKIARIEGIEMAGKTGTAQVVSLPADSKKSDTPFHLRDHAWFAAFAPFQNPEIAVVVLIEHGGSGSAAAGPLAKKIIDRYLGKVLN